MTELQKNRDEERFSDKKPPLTAQHALVESNRCLFCEDAPCIQACPTSIDIPQFIRKIGTGNVRGAAQTIFESNILGMSCARVCPVEVLCVGDCVYNHMDSPPIQIGKLQRFATDAAFAAGWHDFKAGAPTGKSVGLVGGGPASLAAAHELRRFGHDVTLYEKNAVLGGLNTTGVAPYKMKADRALTEVDWILSIGGITVKTSFTVGKDASVQELVDRHDAVFLGMGLGPDRTLKIPGEDLAGVHGAVAFIEQFKLGQVSLAAVEHAVVVGGGNTAIDAVRALRGLGVPHVKLIYRGTEAMMSGYTHEWAGAKTEGVTALFGALPVAYLGESRVERVRVIRMNAKKEPIPGSEMELPADLVLLAVGQSKLGALVANLPGVVVNDGCVVVDDALATGHPKVFAGGDCINGGKEVVNAAADGKRAAASIDRFLRGSV